jgi:5-dehydro-2-deoxygluconokinase
MLATVSTQLDLVAIGRVSVDLYGQQVGSRLEDVGTFAKAVGGSPANVAIGAARLGLRSALITRVGDEPMGRFVREQLVREGVEARGVHVDPERLTALVLLSVRDAETFPLIFYRENCADAALSPADIDAELVASARAVLVTGTHFSLPAGAEAQRAAMRIAKAHGRRVILDIDYRPSLWGIGGHDAGENRYARSARVTQALGPLLPECDLIVGTEAEMHIAAGTEDMLEAIRRIRELSAAVLVCKRGPRGCVVFGAGPIPARLEDALVVAGLDIEVYNVLGAGDAFLAGFLLGYLRDEPHASSARYANACGALAVSRLMCSPEFASRAELDYLLAHGSRYRALRQDPELAHLHRVTTRTRGPATLCAMAAAGPLAPAVIDAAVRVADGRAGFGLRLEGASGLAALPVAERPRLWLARSLQGGASVATALSEWPTGLVVAYRCQYRLEDPRELREAQERDLVRLVAACDAQGRELLLQIDAGGTPALAHLYELGIRPDWWLLEAAAEAADWPACARVIGTHDPYCRGVLLALETPAEAAAEALAAAAATPIVRGFIAGGSITADLEPAWRSGRMSAESMTAEMAQRFRTLVEVWMGGH